MTENLSVSRSIHHTERAVLTADKAASPACAERRTGRPIKATLAPAAAKVSISSSVYPPSGPMIIATFVQPGATTSETFIVADS